MIEKEPIDYLVIDFDKTLIRENLLIEWVLFLLFQSNFDFKERMTFLLKSICRGLTSFLLSQFSCFSERAVEIAYGNFRNVRTKSIHELIYEKSKWKKGFAINLNTDLLEILQKILIVIRPGTSSRPKIIITSQGSFALAIRIFLERQDVVEHMKSAGISVDTSRKDHIIANRLEAIDDRFTGLAIPPVVTKHNRFASFPPNALFVGDGKDEYALKRMGKTDVTFINYKKIAASD